MKTRRVLAADLGASGGKCFVGTFDKKGFSLAEIHRFAHEGTSFFNAAAGGYLEERTYWDDVLLYRNIVQGLQNYRRNVSDSLDSIGIDTWGADGQFVSAEGDLLGKVYCYRDHRLDNMVDKVKARINPARIYDITGIHFQPFNVSNQLLWFMMNRRHVLKPGCVYLPIPTLFYYYLGGCKQVDSSWASVTQLMDARKRKWSDEVLKKLGIPASVMPGIVAPGTVVGTLYKSLAESIGINPARLIAVGSHDTASAFAAAPVADPAESLIISSGTWSLIGRLVPEPITSDTARSLNISNEGGIGNIRLLKNCMGSWLVQELRRIWRIADGRETEWAELDRLTESAESFTAFIDPDDPGFYNPSNMESAINAFCRRTKQKAPVGRGVFMRMVYESLALKYRLVNEQISSASGTSTRCVNIVGGGSKNKMLNRFTADCLGVPVFAGPEEATAVGNIMVQAMGLGLIRKMKDALPVIKQAFPIKEYKPRDTVRWEQAYARFKTVCGIGR